MIRVTFLKKDDLAFEIYKSIWENRNLWYVPHLKALGGHFQGLHKKKSDTPTFILEGKLYLETDKILINKPEESHFSQEEINSTVKIEKIDFDREKGQGKFLTDDNWEKRFELIEV
ncbi:MAG: hypothetical protein K5873_04365 [Treponema sp.]|nr:hypothetical protein [Treponema sp.]